MRKNIIKILFIVTFLLLINSNCVLGFVKKDFKEEEIKHWLQVFIKRFFTQQFKRNCIPDGPKVGTVSLSPRGDLRMPSDASYNIWLNNF